MLQAFHQPVQGPDIIGVLRATLYPAAQPQIIAIHLFRFRDMALLGWEDPGNHWLDFGTDDESGEVVATGMFGPGLELLVTCADDTSR